MIRKLVCQQQLWCFGRAPTASASFCFIHVDVLWCNLGADGELNTSEAPSLLSEADTSSVSAAAVSSSEQDTEHRLFVKRATVLHTPTVAPYEQVEYSH